MKYKLILLICALSLIFSGCSASSKKPEKDTPALSAYLDILKAAPAIAGEHAELSDAGFGYEENQAMFGNHLDCFAILDINSDGTPELIAQSIVNSRWAPVSVYTFADGKAVLLNDPLDPQAHGTFEQCSTAGGAYITYVCTERHIHSVWRGTTPMGDAAEENYAYVLSGTELTLTDCSAGEGENTVYLSDIAAANTAENLALIGQ